MIDPATFCRWTDAAELGEHVTCHEPVFGSVPWTDQAGRAYLLPFCREHLHVYIRREHPNAWIRLERAKANAQG